jgi:hypothetical protein
VENRYNMLVGKPEGKRPLGRPRCRWKDNIRIDIKEIVWEDVYCIHLAQDRVQLQALHDAIMSLWVPKVWGIS